MSCYRHFDSCVNRTRTFRWSCEQLEPRLLLTADAAWDAAPGAAEFADVADVGTVDNWNLNAIHAPEAWAHGYTGQGVVVALVDSGIAAADPALRSQLWSNTAEIAGNGRDDDANGFIDDTAGWDFVADDNRPDDESGHGTHIAGIVAAQASESGVLGVAPGATIMPVRVLDGGNLGTNANIAAGIRYAANSGADVINVSIGGTRNASVYSAIQYALSRDVLVVAAAGNDAAPAPTYPAAFSAELPNVISAGAYRQPGSLGHFSNGVGSSGAVQVDAPGIYIHSTFLDGKTMYMSGTSMATPHVAGIAALALSANPRLTAAELRNLIVDGADPPLEGSDARGAVNAARTVALAAISSAGRQEIQDRTSTSAPRRAIAPALPVASPLVERTPASSTSRPRTPTRTTPQAVLENRVVENLANEVALTAAYWRLAQEDDTEIDVWLESTFAFHSLRRTPLAGFSGFTRSTRL